MKFLANTFGNAGGNRKNCEESMVFHPEISTKKTARFICRPLREQTLATAFLDSSVSSTDN